MIVDPFDQDALADAPVVSEHAEPQISPQEWDCGCVTAVYVGDRRWWPFEMRIATVCSGEGCAPVRDAAVWAVDRRFGHTAIEGNSTRRLTPTTRRSGASAIGRGSAARVAE